MGRPPTPVPQDVADAIVDWVSNGKTLRDFCRIEGNPAFRTVYDWLEKDKEFAARFAHARETGHDVIAEECLAIMDDGSNDWLKTERGLQVNVEAVQRSKLRVWGRLQLLAKWSPRKYGDALKLEHSGSIDLAGALDAARKRAAE